LSPTTVDDLMAAVDCSDCKIRWFKDSVLQSDIEGLTVSADQTTKGETWSILVTEVADDGTEGLPGEAEAMIVNSPPDLGELSISPSEEVYTNDILTASIDASDADDEAFILSYAWTVDGSAVDSTSDSLDGQVHFDKGQEVILTVTATDGEAEVQVSSEVIEVLNSKPTAPEVSIISFGGGGYAASFDGENDYVDLGMGDELADSSWTLEAWARVDQVAAGGSHVFTRTTSDSSSNSFLMVSVGTDGKLKGKIQDGGDPYCVTEGFIGGAIEDGEWFHVAFSRSIGSGCSLYMNGELVESRSDSGNLGELTGEGALVLGQRWLWFTDTTEHLGGAITEARVWDSVRTDQEIADHWDTVLDGTESGLLGYWPLQEGEGESSEDASGGGSTATLIGAGWESLDGELELYEDEASAIQCSIDTTSTDADGDEITYSFSWDVDGTAFDDAETTDHEGDTVSEDVFQNEETWTCSVMPNDGEEDGEADVASTTFSSCGNGQLESGEQCDDGGLANYDGCDSSCQLSCELDPNATPVGSQDFESSWGTDACGNSFIATQGYSGIGIRPSSHWAQLIVASGGSNVKPTAFSYYQLLQSGSLGSEVKMGFGKDARCDGVYARAKGLRTSTNLNWAEGDKDHTRVFLHETASEAPEDWVGADHEMVEDGVWQQVIVFIQDDWQLTCLGGEAVLESNLDASQVSAGTHITIGAWADSAVPSESYPVVDEIEVWQ